jgi:CRISPR-associated endonuclease/helicase Cas3
MYRPPPVERPEDASDILDMMLEAGTGIVYANTVERAYRYWTHLTERAGDLPVFLYHSRFTEPDKKRIEDALVGDEEKGVLGALGRRAWEAGQAHGIAVLTQIGEMSINISAPLMLSDLCPWDRLAQRAGRLARFKDLIPEGELHVADPHQKETLYPAPYGSFDGPATGWTAGAALLETRARIDALTAHGPLTLTPERLVREVDALYPEPEEPDARTRANVDALRRMMRDNWMIVPRTEPRDDEADIPGQWRSRDIPPQVTLLILDEETVPEGSAPLRLDRYAEFHSLQLEHGVTCPHYLVDRAQKRGALGILHYTIGNDPEPYTAYWCVKGYEPPDEHGRGGGLGSLSVRDAEDNFAHVSH